MPKLNGRTGNGPAVFFVPRAGPKGAILLFRRDLR